jgi:hypothetical protein
VFEEARCKKNKYCSFIPLQDTERALKEACEFCGRTVVWNKDEYGRMDNKKYLRFHVRDTAQPKGITARVFKECYGKEQADHILKKWETQREDVSDSWDQTSDLAHKDIQEMRKSRQTL